MLYFVVVGQRADLYHVFLFIVFIELVYRLIQNLKHAFNQFHDAILIRRSVWGTFSCERN